MLKCERQFVVSTDSSGLLGTPEVWRKVWIDAFDLPNFKGFEMIGWGGRFRLWTHVLLSEAGKRGCNVVGIHGRIGKEATFNPLRNLKAGIGNKLLLDTPYLINKYGNKFDYILLHASDLEASKTRQAVTDNSHIINQIFIENHLSFDSFSKTIETVRQLRFDGVNAGIMFDLFHYFNSHNRTHALDTRWSELLHKINWVLNTAFVQENVPIGLHVPVGTNMVDSLPEEITNNMWLELGMLISEHPEVILVIENRQHGSNQLFLTQEEIRKQRKRNKQVLDKFSNCKLI